MSNKTKRQRRYLKTKKPRRHIEGRVFNIIHIGGRGHGRTADWETCTSCTKKFPDESMECDAGGNWFCPACWKELAPVMQAEYEELLAKGEIEEYPM